ncbi:TatD family hydrolase [Eubacteriales bacterium OttesenSCG-928-N13]|nr:TatD family hydrolase [Eubacteriales bacterium OttesenSCG-928-N13]
MNLFDTHCHLMDDRFDEDRDQTIQRMKDAGVTLAVVVGDAANDPLPSIRLAQQHPFMYCAAGVHPHDASCWDEARAQALRGWMDEPKLVALGEIGLDYHYDLSPRDIQKAAFEAQLQMAYELKKPVILHIREAHGDATEMLISRHREGRLPAGVMHCYTGSWESAKTYLSMGLYISLSGTVTFKNAPKLWEVAENCPLDRLLIETDCPYMAPVPMRGKRNEPAFVRYTAQRVAELRNMDIEALADAATENGKRLFGIR